MLGKLLSPWQARDVARASDIVNAAVRSGPAALLTRRGFRKHRLAFKRAHGETVQAITFQLSKGNLGSNGSFFINVGIALDALRALVVNRTGDVVLAGEPMDWGVRLEGLVAHAPAVWSVDGSTDASELGERVCQSLAPVLDILDRADGPQGALATLPLDRGFNKVLRAQLRFVSGNPEVALEDMKSVADEFADRRGCTLAELLARAGLSTLQ